MKLHELQIAYLCTGRQSERDAVTGALRQPAGRDGCWTNHDAGLDCKRQQSLVETSGIALSPQGETLYAGGNYDNAVTGFERRHGKLRMLPGREACVSQTGALPNYFGDSAVWWGLFLVSASAWPGVFTLLSPIAMTYFLVFATGARLLERGMEKRPGYREYQQRTSYFLPRPPKRAGK